MSDAKVVFAGDAASLLAEHKKIEEAKTKEIAGLKALLAESKKTYSEEQKHLREKQVALDKTRTAQEVYNAQIQKWFNLMASGKMTLAEFNRLKGVETKALNDSTAALAKQTKEQQLASAAKQTDTILSRGSQSATIGMSGAFGTAATVIATATMAMRAYSNEQKRIQEEASGVVTSVDTMARKYAVQAGLKPEEMRGKRDEILEVAKENAVSADTAFSAATQLSAMGLGDKESLDSFLKVRASSNLQGEDPKKLIMAMNQYMEGSGIEMNSENMLKLGVQMRGLFKNTQVEVSDLEQFAQAVPSMSQKMSDEESLAILSALRQSMAPSLAATAGKNIVSIMGTTKGDATKTEALDAMGLKWDEIDMIGESPKVALTKLRDARDRLAPEDRAPAMFKLFGRDNESAATALLDKVDMLDEYTEDMKDTAGFASGVEMAQSGDAARKQREAITVQQSQLKNEDMVSFRDYIKESEERKYVQMVANIDNSNKSPMEKKVAKAALFSGKKAKEFGMSVFGIDPDEIYDDPEAQRRLMQGHYEATNQTFSENDLKQRMGQQADPQAAAMARQNQLLENIAGNQQRQADAVTNPANRPTVNPNAAGRPDK